MSFFHGIFGKNTNISGKISSDKAAIEQVLTRGVEDVFVMESLRAKLFSGKPLRIKFGIDPTGPKIHIGRAVSLRKLRAFQDLGHTVVLIVGDFTAQIGDPSDKLEKRPMLTPEQIRKNTQNYVQHLGLIIDLAKTEVVYNNQWLKKLTFAEIATLAESFSIQQMSNRRNFKERLEKGNEISLREFFYPLMQGYDSVAVRSDVEIGGFDQLFNLKAGRVIQKHYGQPEQDVLTVQMLEGTDGRKMSTSWGNVINITDDADDMFGKVMSLRDELIPKYFLLATSVAEEEIRSLESAMRAGAMNPRDAKIRLAQEIVTLYHGEEKARRATENFENAFSKGGVPDDVSEISVPEGAPLIDIALQAGTVQSKGEFRRLIGEGAVTFMDQNQKIIDSSYHIDASRVGVYKIGKRRFLRIKIK